METLFRKILCPVDFTRISIPALELARKLAKQNGASVILLCVIPAASASEPDLPRFAEDNLRAVAHKWLAGEVRHETAVRIGEPATAILAAAEELGADVILMATHGRTGEDRARLGSVTEQVVSHSTRPVVTIRPE